MEEEVDRLVNVEETTDELKDEVFFLRKKVETLEEDLDRLFNVMGLIRQL